MTPNSSLGNVISRLQGLKHFGGRKVMPGAEFLQKLEAPANDIAGTANQLPDFSQFLPLMSLILLPKSKGMNGVQV